MFQVSNALSTVGVPARSRQQEDFSVTHGLRAAILAMCECSDIQHEKRTSLKENASKVLNRCVICIRSARHNSNMKSLKDIFQNSVLQHKKVAGASDQYVTLQAPL